MAGKNWGRGRLLRGGFLIELASKVRHSSLKKNMMGCLRRSDGWDVGLHPGCSKNLRKILTWNLKFAIMWCLLNCLFLTTETRYCLETLSICRVDVAKEFASVFKKLQKCWHHNFLHFGLFLPKNEEFSPRSSFYAQESVLFYFTLVILLPLDS